MTPLALRYSILSESTLGMSLFVMLCAYCLFQGGGDKLTSPCPDHSTMLIQITQCVPDTAGAGGGFALSPQLPLRGLAINRVYAEVRHMT